MSSVYFISYDISDPKRLRKVAKTLENFGIRIQKSFFQCEMSEEMKNNVVSDILFVIDQKKDSLIVTTICSKCLEHIIPIGEGSFFATERYQIL